MSTATGLREVTDDDLDKALERVLLPRLADVLAARGAGHCVRPTVAAACVPPLDPGDTEGRGVARAP